MTRRTSRRTRSPRASIPPSSPGVCNKARAKFGSAWGATDGKYGATCLTTNEGVDMESKVDDFVVSVVCALDSTTCPAPTPTPTPLP